MMGDPDLPQHYMKPSRWSSMEYFPKMSPSHCQHWSPQLKKISPGFGAGPSRQQGSQIRTPPGCGACPSRQQGSQIRTPPGYGAWPSRQQGSQIRTPPGFGACPSRQQGSQIRAPPGFGAGPSRQQGHSSRSSVRQPNKVKEHDFNTNGPVGIMGPGIPQVPVIQPGPLIQEDSESDMTDASINKCRTRNIGDKVRQNMKKITFFVSFLSSSKSTHKKYLMSNYHQVKNSTPDTYCIQWSGNFIDPIFPPVTVLRTTQNRSHTEGRKINIWRSPIIFSCQSRLHSDAIVCHDVYIPHSYEKGYGRTFLYICLPKDLESKIRKAGEKYPSLSMKNKEVNNTKQFWWEIITNVDGLIGVVNEQGTFEPKSLEKIFEKTRMGIKASLILKFYCEATSKRRALHESDITTIGVELVRGNIERLGQMVRLPPGSRNISRMVGFAWDKSISDQLSELSM